MPTAADNELVAPIAAPSVQLTVAVPVESVAALQVPMTAKFTTVSAMEQRRA